MEDRGRDLGGHPPRLAEHRRQLAAHDRGREAWPGPHVRLGLYPIVTLKKQVLNMIGNLI